VNGLGLLALAASLYGIAFWLMHTPGPVRQEDDDG
jgi:hypothetical protein